MEGEGCFQTKIFVIILERGPERERAVDSVLRHQMCRTAADVDWTGIWCSTPDHIHLHFWDKKAAEAGGQRSPPTSGWL